MFFHVSSSKLKLFGFVSLRLRSSQVLIYVFAVTLRLAGFHYGRVGSTAGTWSFVWLDRGMNRWIDLIRSDTLLFGQLVAAGPARLAGHGYLAASILLKDLSHLGQAFLWTTIGIKACYCYLDLRIRIGHHSSTSMALWSTSQIPGTKKHQYIRSSHPQARP